MQFIFHKLLHLCQFFTEWLVQQKHAESHEVKARMLVLAGQQPESQLKSCNETLTEALKFIFHLNCWECFKTAAGRKAENTIGLTTNNFVKVVNDFTEVSRFLWKRFMSLLKSVQGQEQFKALEDVYNSKRQVFMLCGISC